MIKERFLDFNWEKYENWNGSGLSINPKVKGQGQKTQVYCHENYAQDMFDILNSNSQKFIRKDLIKGDITPVTDISFLDTKGKVMIEILGGLTIETDLSREKRFIQLFGFSTIAEFMNALDTKDKRKNFAEQELFAYVTNSSPIIKISLWQGHIQKIKDEFYEQINAPSKAYIAKIIKANGGGFFVDVQGVDAFMPGSLAAPNKIFNFESYVGKEIIVMIEDFMKDMNSFIVSHKKYIDHILPKKLNELSLDQKYTGTVTGASKYGVFAEFDEIFTGLLHRSKMKEETYDKFINRKYSPGDKIEFYIGEIAKDNRIILTEESPIEKKQKVQDFVKKYENKPIPGEIVAIMNFGVIVNMDGLSGVVHNREFKKSNIHMEKVSIGNEFQLKLLGVRDADKLELAFWT